MERRTIFVGYDSRETDAVWTAVSSIRRRMPSRHRIAVVPLKLDRLRKSHFYSRPTERKNGKLYDVCSRTDTYDGAMSTEFAISRFFVPKLATGRVMFVDADVIFRCDPHEVFDACNQDPGKAVWCVKHRYVPTQQIKMDGQAQHYYDRKNWSSVMVFDANHDANQALTLEVLNTWPGRDLHAFRWLPDDMIGSLLPTYNHLVGDYVHDPDAKIVHFTNGGPWFKQYEDVPFADEWRAENRELAMTRYRQSRGRVA